MGPSSLLPSQPSQEAGQWGGCGQGGPRPPLHQGASSLGASGLLGTLGTTDQRVGAKLEEQEYLLAKGPVAHGVRSKEVFHPDCTPQRVGIKIILVMGK